MPKISRRRKGKGTRLGKKADKRNTRKIHGGVLVDVAEFKKHTIIAFNVAVGLSKDATLDNKKAHLLLLDNISGGNAYMNKILVLNTQALARQLAAEIREIGKSSELGLEAKTVLNTVDGDILTMASGDALPPPPEGEKAEAIAGALLSFVDNCDTAFNVFVNVADNQGISPDIKNAYTLLVKRMVVIYHLFDTTAVKESVLLDTDELRPTFENWGRIYPLIEAATKGSDGPAEYEAKANLQKFIDEDKGNDAKSASALLLATKPGVNVEIMDDIKKITDNELYPMEHKYDGIRTVINFFKKSIKAFKDHFKFLHSMDKFLLSNRLLLYHMATLDVGGGGGVAAEVGGNGGGPPPPAPAAPAGKGGRGNGGGGGGGADLGRGRGGKGLPRPPQSPSVRKVNPGDRSQSERSQSAPRPLEGARVARAAAEAEAAAKAAEAEPKGLGAPEANPKAAAKGAPEAKDAPSQEGQFDETAKAAESKTSPVFKEQAGQKGWAGQKGEPPSRGSQFEEKSGVAPQADTTSSSLKRTKVPSKPPANALGKDTEQKSSF